MVWANEERNFWYIIFSVLWWFPPIYQENSVPTMLNTFILMLLSGPNLQHKGEHESQACLTISQLICFNTKSKKSCAESNRHSKDREIPLPMYIGLNLQTQTRSKSLVNNLHKLGISVGYRWVIELESHLATAIYVSQGSHYIWWIWQHGILPWRDQQLHYSDRIDIIWDRYIAGSLKESTRE